MLKVSIPSGQVDKISPRLEIMLTVYGDESTDSKEEHVFAVGGLLATDEEWKAFAIPWVESNRGIPFHSSDCESAQGDYNGKDIKECQKIYRDHIRLLAGQNPLLGIGSAVHLEEFWSIFPNVAPDSPYFLCFQDIVVEFAAAASVVIPVDEVEFIFDRSQRFQYNATVLFDKFTKIPEWRDKFRLNKITFAAKDRTPGVQVADLIARETFKHRENQLYSERKTRLSIKALAATNRFRFRFWTLADLVQLKADALAAGYGKDPTAYAAKGLLRKLVTPQRIKP